MFTNLSFSLYFFIRFGHSMVKPMFRLMAQTRQKLPEQGSEGGGWALQSNRSGAFCYMKFAPYVAKRAQMWSLIGSQRRAEEPGLL